MKKSILSCSLIFAVVVGWVAFANPIEAGSHHSASHIDRDMIPSNEED